jgi:hypothetical protein
MAGDILVSDFEDPKPFTSGAGGSVLGLAAYDVSNVYTLTQAFGTAATFGGRISTALLRNNL